MTPPSGKAGPTSFAVQDGDDFLTGAANSDRLFGGADEDLCYGDFGDDLLYGDGGDDTLYGLWGYDKLYGGAGDDLLEESTGFEVLTGGKGQDTFNFHSQGAGLEANITDFTSNVTAPGSADLIALRVSGVDGQWVGEAAFDGSGPQARFNEASQRLEVDQDGRRDVRHRDRSCRHHPSRSADGN